MWSCCSRTSRAWPRICRCSASSCCASHCCAARSSRRRSRSCSRHSDTLPLALLALALAARTFLALKLPAFLLCCKPLGDALSERALLCCALLSGCLLDGAVDCRSLGNAEERTHVLHRLYVFCCEFVCFVMTYPDRSSRWYAAWRTRCRCMPSERGIMASCNPSEHCRSCCASATVS